MNISIINKTFGLIIMAVFMTVLFSPATIKTDNGLSITTAKVFALGGNNGGDGGSGGSSGGTCCSTGGGSTPTPTPTPSPKPAICNYLQADKTSLPAGGGSVNLTWSTSRGTSATLTPTGAAVALNGSKTVNVTANTTFVLRVVNSDGSDTCQVPVTVSQVAPSCDSFTATPASLPSGGGNVVLNWASTNATGASINQGIGSVPVDGSKTVNVNASKTFTLTLTGAGGTKTCSAPVTVKTDTPAPKCDSFTATPASLPVGGGNVTLNWATTNSNNVKLNGVSVAADGSKTENVTSNKTYTLTVIGTNGELSDSCTASVTVATSNGLSCANNVNFTASDYSLPKSGGDVTLTWSTNGLDSVSITSVSNPGLSGSATLRVTSDKTFTLIGTKNGTSVSCPLSIDVATGGGGGGPAAPLCKLTLSDKKITDGQEVTVKWNTTAADRIILKDDHGNELLDSDDDDDLDSSIKLRPTEDTVFELSALRGNRKVTCKEKVYVRDGVTILETRHQPLVKGISLTQVPYTGFEAGPMLTTIFYVLLTIWGLFVAYVVAVRRNMIGGLSFSGAHDHVAFTDVSTPAVNGTNEPEAASYLASTITDVPTNLPTGIAPVVGYAAYEAIDTTPDAIDESIEMSELENRAHAQKTLFSSDAMRYFMNEVPADGRTEALDTIVSKAKASFPTEDGWVVVNLARLESLMDTTNGDESVQTETAPIAGGSLAEAIVTGNIVAAYQMISNRPMIALADAASELDSVVRSRKGQAVNLSTMLKNETASLTDEQLANAIHALTSAIDGVYTTEEEAVKMAIMKAVKAAV